MALALGLSPLLLPSLARAAGDPADVACFTRVEHPNKPDVGIGDLYACRTTTPRSCDYKLANGETCVFFKHPNTVLCVP